MREREFYLKGEFVSNSWAKIHGRWNERKEIGVESKDGEERKTATGNRRKKAQGEGRELIKSL